MQRLKNSNPIYIMPFVAKSLLVYHALKKEGIPVAGFIDNDIRKARRAYNDTIIYSPQEALSANPGALVILCEMKYYTEMEEQLYDIGFDGIIHFHELKYEDTPEDIIHLFDNEAFISISEDGDGRLTGLYSYIKGLTWKGFFELMVLYNRRPYVGTVLNEEKINLSDRKNLLVCVNATGAFNNDHFQQCLDSIYTQAYEFFYMLVVSSDKSISGRIRDIFSSMDLSINAEQIESSSPMSNFELVGFLNEVYLRLSDYDYVLTINSYDTLAYNALSVIIHEINKKHAVLLTGNEDRIYNEEYIAPYYKQDYVFDYNISNAQLFRNLIIIRTDKIGDLHSNTPRDDVIIIPHTLYHYRVLDGQQNDNHIKPIAFYLPQFHPIPENDLWWGTGFTEWTNVKSADPMFQGHYQPHIPGELGYYDLVDDEHIQRNQIEIARKNGVYGFCYYYYWFNGKRLLEKPLNRLLEDKSLDFPFCICWANENWSRQWDGSENEILIEQAHSELSDERFILDAIPLFHDPRYIKIHGAPLLMIYRAELLPNLEKTIALWRDICLQNGIHRLHVTCAQSFAFLYPAHVGADSITEFHPDKYVSIERLNNAVTGLVPDFNGSIYDYRSYVATAMHNRKREYLRFKGAMLGWDNTARRHCKARIFINSSPEEFRKWLSSLVDFVSRYPKEERLIFINAWNEWAEGTHLEPDEKYGSKFLKAIRESIGINV